MMGRWSQAHDERLISKFVWSIRTAGLNVETALRRTKLQLPRNPKFFPVPTYLLGGPRVVRVEDLEILDCDHKKVLVPHRLGHHVVLIKSIYILLFSNLRKWAPWRKIEVIELSANFFEERDYDYYDSSRSNVSFRTKLGPTALAIKKGWIPENPVAMYGWHKKGGFKDVRSMQVSIVQTALA